MKGCPWVWAMPIWDGACESWHGASLSRGAKKTSIRLLFSEGGTSKSDRWCLQEPTQPSIHISLYFGCCWIGIFSRASSVAKQRQGHDKKYINRGANFKNQLVSRVSDSYNTGCWDVSVWRHFPEKQFPPARRIQTATLFLFSLICHKLL